ncbi:MAG: GNAT family N-acetyltransferase [Bacteroidetes bacterium]|nr:GNAT family N-acetyltransferase [Bacteroidota bacterium]
MIRPARHTDWPAISRLLDQLEYPDTERFLAGKLGRMLEDPAETILVWESADDADPRSPLPILGLLSLHFVPQIALPGDFARISYFAVDTTARSQGIGLQMEEYATRLAREKGCELIEVHCHTRRARAHAFYARQGYKESPKYLIKRLR